MTPGEKFGVFLIIVGLLIVALGAVYYFVKESRRRKQQDAARIAYSGLGEFRD